MGSKTHHESIHKELEKIDPKQASVIHKNNRKRVLRAIEIFLTLGKTKSDVIDEQDHKLVYDAKFFVRDMDRDLLYERINARVDDMSKCHLFDEVKTLVKNYGENLKALQAIGYKELIPVIRGEYSLEEGLELVKKNSRNYAKRQFTYIKHQFPVVFYENTKDLLGILQK